MIDLSKEYLLANGFEYLDEDKEDDTYPSGFFRAAVLSNSGIEYTIEYIWQYKYAVLKNQYGEEIRLTEIKTEQDIKALILIVKGK